ncbi:hypothetical protein MMC24_000815 [Lignoscripta atroalba]|nr:hypothetical protein [Lignoscripta atroalba]
MSNIFIPSQAVPVSPTTQSPVHGYPSFAQFVGKETGYAIFRRFASLNAKNLLYLQVELVQLERQLHRLEVQNSRYNESEALQCRVSDLMSAAPGTNAHMQWQKVQEIGEKLERYNHLLLQHSQLYKLPKPNPLDFDTLHLWLHREDTGGKWLRDPEDTIWAKDPSSGHSLHHDLVALSVRKTDGDAFTNWFLDTFHPWWHYTVGMRFKKQNHDTTWSYDDEALERAASNFTIVLSSLLPTASIFALYFIARPVLRLAFIMVFSAVFTTCLAVFTSAKRIEIFAAAVALASVQVVFIGTSDGNGASRG